MIVILQLVFVHFIFGLVPDFRRVLRACLYQHIVRRLWVRIQRGILVGRYSRPIGLGNRQTSECFLKNAYRE